MVGGALLQYRQNPFLLDGQLTSWKVITSQRFSHRSESSEPHIVVPTLGSLASRGVPTVHTQVFTCTGTPRAKHRLHRSLGQTYLRVSEGLLGSRGWQ